MTLLTVVIAALGVRDETVGGVRLGRAENRGLPERSRIDRLAPLGRCESAVPVGHGELTLPRVRDVGVAAHAETRGNELAEPLQADAHLGPVHDACEPGWRSIPQDREKLLEPLLVKSLRRHPQRCLGVRAMEHRRRFSPGTRGGLPGAYGPGRRRARRRRRRAAEPRKRRPIPGAPRPRSTAASSPGPSPDTRSRRRAHKRRRASTHRTSSRAEATGSAGSKASSSDRGGMSSTAFVPNTARIADVLLPHAEGPPVVGIGLGAVAQLMSAEPVARSRAERDRAGQRHGPGSHAEHPQQAARAEEQASIVRPRHHDLAGRRDNRLDRIAFRGERLASRGGAPAAEDHAEGLGPGSLRTTRHAMPVRLWTSPASKSAALLRAR
jgi:hypothetical protein